MRRKYIEEKVTCSTCGKEFIELLPDDLTEEERALGFYCEECGKKIAEVVDKIKKGEIIELGGELVKRPKWMTKDGYIIMRKVPYDNLLKDLKEGNYEEKSNAIRTLASIARDGNRKVMRILCEHLLKEENIIYQQEIAENLKGIKHKKVVDVLIKLLYRTKSNNTTRRLITAILETLISIKDEYVEEKLYQWIIETKPSWRLKKKVEGMLEEETKEELNNIFLYL